MSLLTLFTLLALLGFVAGLPVTEPGATECQETDVLILGAGMAGINAAKALTNKSITDFVILEYKDHIGGRVFHHDFGKKEDGTPWVIEVGANWVQGLRKKNGPENPILTLVNRSKVRNQPSRFGNVSTYDENGKANYKHLIQKYYQSYDKVAAEAGRMLLENRADRNMRAAFSLNGWNTLFDQYKRTVEWYEWDWEQIQIPEESSEIFGVVSMNATFGGFSDGNLFVIDQRGYNTFIKDLAYTFLRENDPRLVLNSPITKISYSSNSVTAVTSQGCYKAKYAICTFSLGVLQAAQAGYAPVSFHPKFPAWKEQAIASFAFGIYTKIFMQFEQHEIFWPKNVEFTLYADPAIRGYYASGQSLTAPGFIPESGIFIVTVVGAESLRVERQSDEETKAQILQVLRKMFGHDKVPEPKAFYYERFLKLPWTYGSYSNWPPGVSLQEHQNLRSNVDRLWFAGEASSAEYFGYLQGAYFEGGYAGHQVARCLKGGKCSGEKSYPNLKGETPARLYNKANGWRVSTLDN